MNEIISNILAKAHGTDIFKELVTLDAEVYEVSKFTVAKSGGTKTLSIVPGATYRLLLVMADAYDEDKLSFVGAVGPITVDCAQLYNGVSAVANVLTGQLELVFGNSSTTLDAEVTVLMARDALIPIIP